MMFSGCTSIVNKAIDTIQSSDDQDDASSDSSEDKVSIGKDSITINDSNISFGDSLEWPKEYMSDLPEPKGKITAVFTDEKTRSCTMAFSDMSKDDALDYIEKLEDLGYENGLNFSDSDGFMFSGSIEDDSDIMFTYNADSKEATIIYTPITD